jgi:hypothetical protein
MGEKLGLHPILQRPLPAKQAVEKQYAIILLSAGTESCKLQHR